MNKTEPKTELTGENFTVDLSDPTQKEIQDGRHENLEDTMNLTQSENREIQQQMFDVQGEMYTYFRTLRIYNFVHFH